MAVLKPFLVAAGLVVLVALTSLVYFIAGMWYRRWKYRHIPSPNRSLGYLGIASELKKIRESGGLIPMLFHKWAKEYGSAYVIFTWTNAIVICTEPSTIKELLVTTKTSKSKEQYKNLHTLFNERFMGSGLLTETDNDKWQPRRKLINPAFSRGYLKGLMGEFNSSVEELISHLTMVADGKTEVLMAHQLNKVALDIIAKVAFGLDDLNVIADDSAPFCRSVGVALKGVQHQLLNPFWMFDIRRGTRKLRKEVSEAITFVREVGKNCILNRIKDINAGNEYPEDILSHILRMSNNLEGSEEIDLEQMVDEFVTFFGAGQETTSQLMTFTFELAGRNPEVYRKLQEEVDRVIGSKDTVSFDDLPKLEYMNLVLKEVLRFAPPVNGVVRYNDHDITINGYKIPAGSSVLLSHYAAARSEKFWDNPDEFDPERFRGESDRHMYAYFPFSLGARSCIGQTFAQIEAKVVLAKLLQRFDYRLKPGVRLDYVAEVTTKPKHKTPLYLTVRHDTQKA